MKSFDFSSVERLLEKAIEDGAFPGAVAAVGTKERLLWIGGFGSFDYEKSRPVRKDSIYDLASVTKVAGTTAVLMRLADEGKLEVSRPVADYLPEFAKAEGEERKWREELSMEQLLRHRSGLPSWKPFYRSAGDYEELLSAVISTPFEDEPGRRYRYSDLGFILLGEIASRAGGESLPELERRLVFEPLGMDSTIRNPSESLKNRIPPTERDPEGEGFVHGIVHDENSRAGGGITGHAGLFSTAEDLGKFASELLKGADGESRYFSKEIVELFTERKEGSHRGLGWLLSSGRGSSGSLLSGEAFGHTGFTGTSIWIDPANDLYLILLTNRVHPTRENQKIGAVRSAFADAVFRAVRSRE